MTLAKKTQARLMRKARVKRTLAGLTDRPRLSIFRSSKYIYAQIIDDLKGQTLCAASSLEKGMKTKIKSTRDLSAAKEVGKALAERAKAKSIKAVVFDRGGYMYHGRVKALAEGAREGGLNFYYKERM